MKKEIKIIRECLNFGDSQLCKNCKKHLLHKAGYIICNNVIYLRGKYYETECDEFSDLEEAKK
jgi:hypothetical protein